MSQPSPTKGIRSGRYRALAEAAISAGWAASTNGQGHLSFAPPAGGRPVVLSKTIEDKDQRAYLNVRAAFRRGGLDV